MALNNFLLPFIIVNFDLGSSEVYGKIRSDLEKKGRPIGSMDLLIAAQAISLNITLVTNNTKEFDRISGIKIENWVK
jgi:tRNA(fMet)-specific endonuclease VapC